MRKDCLLDIHYTVNGKGKWEYVGKTGETLSLRWENVDFENNIFIIDASNNKSKRIRRVLFNSFLRTLLLELRLKNGMNSAYVFL